MTESIFNTFASVPYARPLGESACKFQVLPHVVIHVTLFFVFHSHQSRKLLSVQFLHDRRNFRNTGAKQHVHFAVHGLNIFEVHQYQTRSQFAHGVDGIMAARCKMSHICRGADGFGKSRESAQHILRTLVGELLALEVMIVDSEGQLFLRKAPIDSIQNAASSIACDIACCPAAWQTAQRFLNPDLL